jgi:hypothetical protein
MINISVSIGEFIDKISILLIKKENIIDTQQNNNVSFELSMLLQQATFVEEIDIINLKNINQKLWNLEEQVRVKPTRKLAIEIFKCNDERANLKKEINLKYKSQIFEEKQYTGKT